ncbi:unnamed protein product [Rotaria magnacalcarata]|uniref:Uncharacterized protein n=3 Tax=Rotaria magnacalcarata TaxID=392030 RepID=A0A816ZYS8_9BILA|nr:unnamed protein product [Rotaria magnacalcarata]
MKLSVFIFALLMILVQTIFSQATLTQSSLDNSNLKRMSSAWGKRMSSAWGKRMSSAWGKRGESDSDELNANILRELYRQGLLSKYHYPRYPIDFDNDVVEHYLAQRRTFNNDDETAPQNMS